MAERYEQVFKATYSTMLNYFSQLKLKFIT